MWCGSPGPLIVDTMMIPSRSTHRERRQMPRTCLEGLAWSSRFLGFLELSLHCLWFQAAFHHTTLLLASPGPLTLTVWALASAQFGGALGFITLPGSFVALPAKGPCYVNSWGLGNDCLLWAEVGVWSGKQCREPQWFADFHFWFCPKNEINSLLCATCYYHWNCKFCASKKKMSLRFSLPAQFKWSCSRSDRALHHCWVLPRSTVRPSMDRI